MLCPVCHLDLIPADLGSFGLMTVHRCMHCAGSWVKREELERLGASVAQELAAMVGQPGTMPCPQCAGVMASVSPPAEQPAHRCVGCGGFWIDERQLERTGSLVDDESSRVIDRRSVDARPQHWSALRWIAWRLRRCYE